MIPKTTSPPNGADLRESTSLAFMYARYDPSYDKNDSRPVRYIKTSFSLIIEFIKSDQVSFTGSLGKIDWLPIVHTMTRQLPIIATGNNRKQVVIMAPEYVGGLLQNRRR